ncbi:unnamed protein product [Soboliphyme baturini]|uniref:ABC1 domain-containing protein n=1 Tax=Soboliphyme baturini TaxID=241478 RepID=A0A183I8X8_9BILA|nr:unnamed protein product [Soboliphyme baturini]
MLRNEFGDDWEQLFEKYEEKPFAAASIGEVHRVVLKSGEEAALKIQYPGVAQSIDSDINNLLSLLSLSTVLPRGLFLDNFAKVMHQELALECDYLLEAQAAKRFK